MKRREILKASALAIGYTALGGATFTMVNGCKVDTSPSWKPETLSLDNMKIVSAVVDRIIPKTATPGAIEAGIDRYLDSHVRDNMNIEEQETFKASLNLFNAAAQSIYKTDFPKLTSVEMDEVLTKMSVSEGKDRTIFNKMKSMTSWAFFSSELGATQVLNYVPVPGPYKGCVPLSETKGTYALD